MPSRPIPRPVRLRRTARRAIAGLLSAATCAVLAPAASAQFYGGDACGCSGGSSYYGGYSTASYAPMSYASYASAGYGGSYQTVSGCTPIYQTAAVECTPIRQVQTVAVCEPPRMVAVPKQVSERVPVTKYVSVQETVKRPRTVTRYEDREFTEMVPQVETRTAMTQQVNYRPVASTQQVVRDAGYWQTRRIANPMISPCQYDPRPGFAGSMNRLGYNIRSMFTPRFTTQRQYVPRQMACNVTTHSQVAEVTNVPRTYQVTTMVPQVRTRQVAVQEVVWEDQKVTAMKPVTEYQERTRTVYNYLPSTDPVAVAYLEGRGNSRTALAPERDAEFDEVPTRSADATKPYERDEDTEFDDAATSYNLPRRGSRRVSGPSEAAPPKVRVLTDADRERLAALKLAARNRGANDTRMAARPTSAAAPATASRRIGRTPAIELTGAAGRVPQVTAARRWDVAGPRLPLVASAR
ncbi:MAG: hypothetical protein AAF907_09370 [Planctomycetota bacterium]